MTVLQVFSSGNPVEVTLKCEASVMNGFVDQFGTRTETAPLGDDMFIAKVSVCTSPTFYAWVFLWGGKVEIMGPERVAEEFQRMLAGQVKQLPGQ